MGIEVNVRPRVATDDPFIFKSWLRSCRGVSGKATARTYFAEMHDRVEKLIGLADVLVAVAASDSDFLIGFICTSRLEGSTCVLHFAYVKKDVRRYGVFKHCLARGAGLNLSQPFFYTHETLMTPRLQKGFPHAIFRRDVLDLVG